MYIARVKQESREGKDVTSGATGNVLPQQHLKQLEVLVKNQSASFLFFFF